MTRPYQTNVPIWDAKAASETLTYEAFKSGAALDPGLAGHIKLQFYFTGFTGTLDFQISPDGTNYHNVPYSRGDTAPIGTLSVAQITLTTETGARIYVIPGGPWRYFRIVMTRSAGTITCWAEAYEHDYFLARRVYTDAEAIAAVEGEATLDLTGNVTIAASKSLAVDTIAEKTAAAGVTIDGVELKDGGITVLAGDHIGSGTGNHIQFPNNSYMLFGTDVDLADGKAIRTRSTDNNTVLLQARDNGVGMVTVGRLVSAADAYLEASLGLVLGVIAQPGTPVEGMLVYNSVTNKLNFWNGAAWEVVTSA